MPRAINFFSLSLSHSLVPRHCPRRFEEESIIIIPPPSFLGWNMLSSTSLDLIPSDISMVKSNFSPLDSHRLTYGQRGGRGGEKGFERFSFEFLNPSSRFFALVFTPTPSSNLPFHYPISTNVPIF